MNRTITSNQISTKYKSIIGYILLIFISISSASNQAFAQGVEICDNRIDDDGDGLIDCLDPDCSGTETCWDCITEFYQVHSNQYLVALDPATGTYTDLGSIFGAEQINGLQFNQVDGHVYAPIIKNGVHKLGMLLTTGEVRETGLDLPGNNIFYVGSIDADGTMYVSNSGGIYSIELNAQNLEAVDTGLNNPSVADFALDITRGLFYGITGSAQLKVFDPISMDINTYDLAGSINNESGAFGAAWSSNDGSFFAYNNSSGKIYSVDVNTLTATQVINATGNLSINDGFNCVLAPPPFESNCNNGIDDDGDGVMDCDDGDCFTSNVCTVEICDNGIDDDGDGWIDCSDTECFNLSFCVEICDNGIDDNGDGLIDGDDPQCNTPAGVTGGLESNGSLADKVSKRNIKLAINNDDLINMKKEGAIPFNASTFRGAFDLSNFIPQDFNDAFVAESTPDDLVDITNAEEVVAADYYINNQRVASILAIESNGVYEHTKYICDRLAGSRLLDISQMYAEGGLFMTYELLNTQSKVEYVVSFSMHHEETKGFTLENHWNLHAYPIDKEYYNFQIWASDYQKLTELVAKTLEKVTVVDKIASIENSNLPTVFVTYGSYKNGNLRLQIRNKIGAKELKFSAMVRRTETSELEPLEIDVPLSGAQSELIDVPVGYLYDLGSSLITDGSTSDEIFLADGRWTVDTEHPGANVIDHEITKQNEINTDDGHQIERGLSINAEVTDYLNIYRSINPKFQAINLSDYNAMTFTTSGSGLMDITLVKASVENWADQPRVKLRLNGTENHSIMMDQFSTIDPTTWNDLVMIVFSLINDQGEKQSFQIEISDVVFKQLTTNSTENIKSIIKNSIVSPNPITDLASIKFISDRNSVAQIELYDNLGRITHKETVAIVAGENNIILNLENLIYGSYTYTIKYKDTIHYNGKLMKI